MTTDGSRADRSALNDRYDAVIVGGGLAGLCLAIQLRQRLPEIEVLVAERKESPAPFAAHKVGESSVEMASHYFVDVLGLGDVLSNELPKFGLRFLLSSGDNSDVASRLECGPSHFLTVPSFQIDRGQFENALAVRALELGVHFERGCSVRGMHLGAQGLDHRIDLERGGQSERVGCRWLIDASGRASLLKRQLGVAKASRHAANAAWFRIDHPIDIDDWSDDLQWSSRLKHSRRLSTNHLMGEGYWVWLIPLAGGRTSVGIVTDAELHSFAEISSYDRALEWLERHEPQCADVVRRLDHERLDFKALRHYAHDAKQVFSADRWGLVGDAGLFLDPLYSPGSDFIGVANCYLGDLIARDLRQEDIAEVAERYDRAYRSLGRTYLVNYHRQYPIMGSPRVMTTKVIWDFAMYWGGVALLFFSDRLCDERFVERTHPIMQRFAALNIRMQALFRDWAANSRDGEPRPGAFVDYAELEFLARMNAELKHPYDEEALLAKLESNLALAEALQLEIRAEAAYWMPGRPGVCAQPARSEHLSAMFRTMRPAD